MRRGKPDPRFITPASIDVGDTIRVTWKVGEVEHSRVAKISHIHDRTFFAPDGQEVFRWEPSNRKVRVTLLDKANAVQQTLPGMEADLGDIRQRVS
jgi:hypothetical protein